MINYVNTATNIYVKQHTSCEQQSVEQSGTLIALESEEWEAENNLDISDETRNKSFVCLYLQPFTVRI